MVVEQHAPDGSVDRAIDFTDRGLDHVLRVALGVEVDQTALVAQADIGLRRDLFGVEREHHLLRRGEGAAFALRALHRTARIIDALAQQVLAEAPLFSLELVRERFERAVVDAAQHAPPAAVVEQRVHGLLEHSLLVADDDFRSLQFDQLRKPVVAVDDAAVEVVQIRSGEASAVERDERAQFGRDDPGRDPGHPARLVARFAERVHDLEPLREFELLLLARLVLHLVSQFFGQVIDVDLLEQSFDGFRPHLADLVGELAGELLLELPVALVGDHLALFERKAQAVDVLLVRDDDVILEVENLLEFAQGDVEQVADAARQTFEEPDVRAGAGQLDVAQPLAADFRLCDLDAAFVADHAAVLHAFVFSAQALPVGYRAEDARAEQAVALGFECAVVDRFRFRDVAVRPRTNLLGRSEADANRFEIRCKRLLSCISNHFTYSPL